MPDEEACEAEEPTEDRMREDELEVTSGDWGGVERGVERRLDTFECRALSILLPAACESEKPRRIGVDEASLGGRVGGVDNRLTGLLLADAAAIANAALSGGVSCSALSNSLLI